MTTSDEIWVNWRPDIDPMPVHTHGRTVQEVACDVADMFEIRYDDPRDCRIAVDGKVWPGNSPADELLGGPHWQGTEYRLIVVGRRP